MKPVTLALLLVSLVFNAALAYVALSGAGRGPETPAPASQPSALNEQSSGSAPLDPATWTKLKTEDLTALVTRLRDAGFPKDVMRAMLTGLLTEQFAARRRALDPDAASRAFWKDTAPDPKFQLAQLQLYREQEKALRELLGPDARSTDPLALARLRSRFGHLPPDKLDAVQLLESDFGQKRSELYYTKGTMNMADTAALDREQRTALAAILSPAELEEYDLRSSNTGRSLRTQLTAFNPTEEEFRALFKLRQPFEERYNYNSGVPSQDDMRARSEAQKQLNTEIAAVLGPVRAVEYERAIDSNYRQTSQLVARLELPPETTVSLWNTQKEFEKRRAELYTAGIGPGLTPAERGQQIAALQPQLAALQQEAVARITPLLGNASRVEAYKQYGGSWIQNLMPRPAPTPAPAR